MRYCYRLLRPDEDETQGIKAKDPYAQESVWHHVSPNYKPCISQFISTCDTKDAAELFASKAFNRTGNRKLVSIDVAKLTKLVPDRIYFNLTDPDIRALKIPAHDEFARNCARKFEEILIQIPVMRGREPVIPKECITVIDYV